MKSVALIVLIAAVVFIAACKSEKKTEEQTAGASGKYSVVTVVHGGTITGTVKIEGPTPSVPDLMVVHDNGECGSTKPSPRLHCGTNGGVSNAVVYLVDITSGKKMEMPAQPQVIMQKGCMYDPHITAVPVGATVAFKNEDHVLHNVHIYMDSASVWNQAQPIFEQTNLFTAAKPGLMRMQCDAGHIWMSGYIWVAKNPYYTITDENGNFTITEIPAGNYKIACWHEGWSATAQKNNSGEILSYSYDVPYELNQDVAVTPADTTHLNFTIKPH
ncbi:MAG TPA: carboxypeptidase regulatory-like domain-containing protein [Candidatus Kapabacteria bacterium]|nr:carboxypeptidase regulatory-like domain-containing protein [Candidatus Kapabacteria bacterium]